MTMHETVEHEFTRAPMETKLIAVATRLFAEKGFDRTTVADIVKEAGVTKGAMYHYFASKDDLLSEVYTRVLRVQMRRLEEIADSTAPVLDRIRAAAADVATTSIENIDDTMIFWRSMHQLGEEQQSAVRRDRREYHSRFKALLEEAVDAGQVRTDIPIDIVIDYFFGAVHHVTSWYHADGSLTPRGVGDYFAELLMTSLGEMKGIQNGGWQ